MTVVGTRVPRLEDARLIRGRGTFVDDVDLPGQLWAHVVRSPIAHGEVLGIDAGEALATIGVVTVTTADDVADVPPIPMRLVLTDEPVDHALQPVLAADRVRYVGEPVAVVVATDPYIAEDAAELVFVDYEPRPAVTDPLAAAGDDQPRLWPDGGNEVATLHVGYGDVAGAFAEAAHVLELDLRIGRHSGVPLETRGLLARPDPQRDTLELWGWTKVAHFNRRVLADMLDLPVAAIRLHGVDAGGGFGVRGEFYPEDLLVPLLARRLGRPVKWVEDRVEHLTAANHSREQRHHVAAAFDADGRILALTDEIWHDNGAYLRTHGVTVPNLAATMLPGPYRVPSYDTTVHVVTTNKTPCGTYRGPGRYETTFVREQLLSVAAARLGIDRLELRRRNLLTPSELPHMRPMEALGEPMELSAADYPALLDHTVRAAGFDAWQREAALARADGRLVGTGVAMFLEKSGLGPYETAEVSVDASGAVHVLTGGASLGQGIETVLGQIAADELATDLAAVEVRHGDTELVPDGVGSWASRSTVVGGSAVKLAAEAVAAQARTAGAELLGVARADVELHDGRVVATSEPSRSVPLGEVAAMREGGDGAPGLCARHTFSVDRMSYPYGVHLAEVEVDPVTAGVRVLRYFVGYEIGRAINPRLVEGQLVGGVAQGLGGALLEEFTYDDVGQPLATTFLDYLLPTAAEVPRVGTLISEDAPSRDNPLGAMGSGEGGCSGVGATIANAIEHAVGGAGVVDRLPVTPTRLFTLLDATEDRNGRT